MGNNSHGSTLPKPPLRIPNRNWLPGGGFYGAGPCRSGATIGEGARSSPTITAVRIALALAGGADDRGQRLLRGRAAPGAIASTNLAGDDGGANGLFGAPVGGVDSGVRAGSGTAPSIPWSDAPRSAERRRECRGGSSRPARRAARASTASSRPSRDSLPARASSRRRSACFNKAWISAAARLRGWSLHKVRPRRRRCARHV